MPLISHDGRSLPLVAGKSVFDYADELRVQVPTSCKRAGSCHECVVEIAAGMEALSPRSEPESFLRANFRLACQAEIVDPSVAVTFTPLRRRLKILADSQVTPLQIDSPVSRDGDRVLYEGAAIDRFRGQLCGLAIDLGTTTVVMLLVDLSSGETLCTSSFANPQRFGGSDVMHRISYDGGRHRGELQRALINAINYEIWQLRRQQKISRHTIYEVVVAGNSTMRDLFFGLDVQSIGQRPYKSQIELDFRAGRRTGTALNASAAALGLRVNPAARVYALPLVASHVGGDTAAALLAIDINTRDDVVMLVDIGTNTEVVVGNRDRLLAASCPAGPAFEGGLIRYGMPGSDGAIEAVRWVDGGFEVRTIGGGEPHGICGSGLIDLLAELRRSGRMTPKGQFAGKLFELAVVPERGITFSREDASNLAQAKAANYCGQYLVLRRFGINPRDVATLFLAGGFANYLDVANAIEIGFLAPVPAPRIVKVGNAALQGAKQALLSRHKRDEIEQLVARIEHVELEVAADFFELFVEGCLFKPMPDQVLNTAAA